MRLIVLLALLGSINTLRVMNGVVYNDKQLNCTIKVNGTITSSNETVVPGVYFGLIRYSCGNTDGYLISEPECSKCGIYCDQNQMIKKCRHVLLPYSVGIGIGLLLSLVIYVLSRKVVPRLYGWYQVTAMKRKIARTEKRCRTLRNLGLDVPDNLLEEEKAKIGQNCALGYRVTPTWANEAFFCLLTTTLALFLLPTVLSCDVTIYLDANTLTCGSGKCIPEKNTQFSISSGQTICFKLSNDKLIQIRLRNTRLITNYLALYQTAEFNLKTIKSSRCKYAGLCFEEHCHQGMAHPDLARIMSNYSVTGHFCGITPFTCNDWCFHKETCIWLHWAVTPKETKHVVYKRVETQWAADVVITIDKLTKVHKLSAMNPMAFNDPDNIFGREEMPVALTSMNKADLSLPELIMGLNGTFVAAIASDLDLPIKGQVGEYQISLDGSTETLASDMVYCSVESCLSTCYHDTTALTKMMNKIYPKERVVYEIVDFEQVTRIDPIPMHAVMYLGNIDIAHLQIDPANCKFSVAFSYGCSGCDKMPYAVLTAQNINNPGVVYYTSNCSFKTQYLSCSNEPTVLFPSEKYDTCIININTLNQSVKVVFHYDFIGKVHTISKIASEDLGFYDIIKKTTSDKYFWDSINQTFWFVGIVGLLTSLLKVALPKITRTIGTIYATRNAAREVSTTAAAPNLPKENLRLVQMGETSEGIAIYTISTVPNN